MTASVYVSITCVIILMSMFYSTGEEFGIPDLVGLIENQVGGNEVADWRQAYTDVDKYLRINKDKLSSLYNQYKEELLEQGMSVYHRV